MKHLKKYNEANAFTFDPDMDLIKDIILELKHEYPSLEGEIVNHVDDDTFTIIKLKPLPIYNDESTKIVNIDKRMKYFNDVIECSKRLQDALGREVRLQNLFNTNLSYNSGVEDVLNNPNTINIWIDDIKHKGKKWRGQ